MKIFFYQTYYLKINQIFLKFKFKFYFFIKYFIFKKINKLILIKYFKYINYEKKIE